MEGRELLQAWCEELGVPFRIPGKLVVAQHKDQVPELERLVAQGEANGVSGLRIANSDAVEALQPEVRGVAALHVPTSGIVPPYALTIALAEDASLNGVLFLLGSEVTDVERTGGAYRIRSSSGVFTSRWVINAAGLYADKIGQALEPLVPSIYPCRGEYLVLDKQAGERLRMLVYPAPPARSGGLGVHLTPTVEGNVLIGPSAEYITDHEDYACTHLVSARLLQEAASLWPSLPTNHVISAYAGVRAKLTPPEEGGFADFFIKESSRFPRFVNLVGLESPALTAAPAIVRYVVEEIMKAREPFEPKPETALRVRLRPKRFDDLPEEEKERLVRAHPDYGEVICRCEGVTKYELLQALNNPLGVQTLAGLKYRCRVMMGRCSGGYCFPRIVKILQGEMNWGPDRFYLRGESSPLFAGWVKEPVDGSSGA